MRCAAVVTDSGRARPSVLSAGPAAPSSGDPGIVLGLLTLLLVAYS